MLLNDREHLPKIVTDINGISDVLLAIEPEIIQLRTDISDFIKELYIKTTEEFITRWERDFSIKYDSALTLQQRRQQILNKLSGKKPLTWENLKTLIKSNIDNNVQFSISNDAENFYFKIYVGTENTSSLQGAIQKAKPAYLTFDIVVTDFFNRYCNTFTCGTEPI